MKYILVVVGFAIELYIVFGSTSGIPSACAFRYTKKIKGRDKKLL